MSKRIIFGSARSEVIFTDIEELRLKRDVDGMIERALRPDSNVMILNEVLTCVREGPVAPVRFKGLLDAMSPSLDRKAMIPTTLKRQPQNPSVKKHPADAFRPEEQSEEVPQSSESAEEQEDNLALEASRDLNSFVFVKDVLPGSCMAESACSSPDGSSFAYITVAAVALQEDRSNRVSRQISSTRIRTDELRKLPPMPRLINIVNFDPYSTWSIKLDSVVPSGTAGSIMLKGIDRERLYLLHEIGVKKRLMELDVVTGLLLASHEVDDRCGAMELDVNARCLSWIEIESNKLCVTELDNQTRHDFPLELPQGLNSTDLHRLVSSQDRCFCLILVAPRAEISGIAFGTIRLHQNSASSPADSDIRWWRRRELLLGEGFEDAIAVPQVTSRTDCHIDGAFYLYGASSSIRKLPLSILRDRPLNDINPLELLDKVVPAGAGKRALLPRLAVGVERPIMAEYDQATGAIQLWETITDSLLMTIPCATHLESIHFIAHDSLLITRYHAMGRTWDPVTITFIDFLLLAGQSPSALTEALLPLIEPLRAWAPRNGFIAFMKLLCGYNSSVRKEVAA